MRPSTASLEPTMRGHGDLHCAAARTALDQGDDRGADGAGRLGRRPSFRRSPSHRYRVGADRTRATRRRVDRRRRRHRRAGPRRPGVDRLHRRRHRRPPPTRRSANPDRRTRRCRSLHRRALALSERIGHAAALCEALEGLAEVPGGSGARRGGAALADRGSPGTRASPAPRPSTRRGRPPRPAPLDRGPAHLGSRGERDASRIRVTDLVSSMLG